MYVWSENIASRGGQEIASCLIKHLRLNLPEDVQYVILYSDSCGGQNRNIKLSTMLLKFLSNHISIKAITQKYFIPGHSYNSCDRSFAIIEKAKRMKSDLYVPNDWIDLIKSAKKSEPKFTVIKMTTADFYSSETLKQLIVNRKKDCEKNKINWFNIRSIKYTKENLFVLLINDSAWLDIKKKNIRESQFAHCNMNLLYSQGRKIDTHKIADLMELLNFIPEEHHNFYRNLEADENVIDYGLASQNV